ncbi:MAG: quinone oxidoreductase [Proteobacteria bacterium]|nr:quinone oxidoreductase [Pseudomonadota bacterium]
MKTKAIRVHETGGPEVLAYEETELGEPAAGEALIRHHAIGLNYIDTYHRSGLYPLPGFPAVIGMEGAGIVEAVGSEVHGLAPGDRVAYAAAPPGAYAEARLIRAESLVKMPESLGFEEAASIMLQGMTVEYLLNRCYPVKPGQTILLHAAAGGIGLIACRWAKELGATVIGTVGTDAKAELARAHGCDHAIVYARENFVERVNEITNGQGVPVVYDSVGKDTFLASLDCLDVRGMLVSFGQASGPVPPFDTSKLALKSLFLTRPSLMAYTAKREELELSANALFEFIEKGVIDATPRQSYPLKDAAQAHIDLEGRRTVGSTVLIP